MKVQLTFNEAALQGAVRMRNLRGIETPDDFEGPLFENASVYVEGAFVVVTTWSSEAEFRDGTDFVAQYLYATSSIARIKEFK